MNQLIYAAALSLLLPSFLHSVKFEIYDNDKQDYLNDERAVFTSIVKKYQGPGTDFQIRAKGVVYKVQVAKQGFDIRNSGEVPLSNSKDSEESRNIGKDCLHILRNPGEKTIVSAEFIKNSTPPQITLSAYATPETAHMFLSLKLKSLGIEQSGQ